MLGCAQGVRPVSHRVHRVGDDTDEGDHQWRVRGLGGRRGSLPFPTCESLDETEGRQDVNRSGDVGPRVYQTESVRTRDVCTPTGEFPYVTMCSYFCHVPRFSLETGFSQIYFVLFLFVLYVTFVIEFTQTGGLLTWLWVVESSRSFWFGLCNGTYYPSYSNSLFYVLWLI